MFKKSAQQSATIQTNTIQDPKILGQSKVYQDKTPL